MSKSNGRHIYRNLTDVPETSLHIYFIMFRQEGHGSPLHAFLGHRTSTSCDHIVFYGWQPIKSERQININYLKRALGKQKFCNREGMLM